MPDDELTFVLHDHDVRLHVGDFYYYVRAVRRGEMFAGGSLDLEGMLILLPLYSVFGRFFERWQEGQPWKVGVVRIEGDRWGPTGSAKVVHKEFQTSLQVPTSRLAELADLVRAGKFAG